MRRGRGLLFSVVPLAVMGAVLMPETVAAQDCGLDCDGCGPFPESYHEGKLQDPFGPWDMECPSFPNEDCNECVARMADGFVSQQAVGRALAEAKISEVTVLMAAYGDRILLSSARNFVAIRGNGCRSDALGVWLSVSAKKMAALRASGIGGSLEGVLAEQAERRVGLLPPLE